MGILNHSALAAIGAYLELALFQIHLAVAQLGIFGEIIAQRELLILLINATSRALKKGALTISFEASCHFLSGPKQQQR